MKTKILSEIILLQRNISGSKNIECETTIYITTPFDYISQIESLVVCPWKYSECMFFFEETL